MSAFGVRNSLSASICKVLFGLILINAFIFISIFSNCAGVVHPSSSPAMQACGPCVRLHQSVSMTHRLQRHAHAQSSGMPVRGKRGLEIGVVNMTTVEKEVTLRAVLAERRRLLRQVISLKHAALSNRPGFSETC